ncbi:MAG: hypothetical protein VB913_01470 [Rhodospirillales bacterium]|jgi:hypothetical protein
MSDVLNNISKDSAASRNEYETGIVSNGKFRRRKWYHRRDLRFIGVVIAIVLIFNTYGLISGPSRISEDLQAAIDSGAEKVSILIRAKFPAEAFHMEIYQKIGVFRGDVGDAIMLTDVIPGDVRTLSRKYWIKDISLAPPIKR